MICHKSKISYRNKSYWKAFLFPRNFGFILSLFLLIQSACQDGINESQFNKTEGESGNVILLVPIIKDFSGLNSRDENDRAEPGYKEGIFSNIYLIYQIVKDENGKSYSGDNAFNIISLTGKESTSSNSDFKTYSQSFSPGTYRFYIAVNFDRYLGENKNVMNTITTEDQLKKLINNFNFGNQTIITEHLPMACLNTEFKRNSDNVKDGEVVINKNQTYELTAPLTFLCAKVRYTILFDASENGISKDFENSRISFFTASTDNQPYAYIFDNKVVYGEEEVLTSIINNPTFGSNNDNDENNNGYNNSKYLVGWTYTNTNKEFKVMNGVARCYNGEFNLYQTIDKREAGLYTLKVQGFYRYGKNNWWGSNYDYFNEILSWQAHLDGTEIIHANMYINEQSVPLNSLYDENYGTDYTEYEGTYPYFEKDANTAFKEGKYNNSLTYLLNSEGSLTIGVKKEKTQRYDWTCFDNFQLSYQPIITQSGSERKIYIDLGKYDWPEDKDDYPSSYVDELPAFQIDDTQWDSKPRKAWQGVTYLPENKATEKDFKTRLFFPYSYSNATEKFDEKSIVLFDKSENISDFTSTLNRGMFYDVVIKVKTSDLFVVNVSVNDWNYHQEEEFWGEPGRNDDQRTFK